MDRFRHKTSWMSAAQLAVIVAAVVLVAGAALPLWQICGPVA
jgi:hypothetical protein